MFTADLHTHTIASTHAYSTVNEYAARAAETGIRLFAMTDHGPELHDAPSTWHFYNLRVLPRIIDTVGVLRGVEANIMEKRPYPDHPLDCDDSVLEGLDIVLAGFHYPLVMPLDKKTHTRLMIEAITCGRVQIISHPGNPQYPIDAKAVAEAATAYNVALEANNSSFLHVRKGSKAPCLELLHAQREAGGLIAVGSDSHHSHSLGVFDEALELVREVAFPEDRIVNATPGRVLDFLALHGKEIPELRAYFAG